MLLKKLYFIKKAEETNNYFLTPQGLTGMGLGLGGGTLFWLGKNLDNLNSINESKTLAMLKELEKQKKMNIFLKGLKSGFVGTGKTILNKFLI